MGKGFTFAQMATLILVIMGLTIVVVLAATQLARLSGQTTEISSGTDVGTAVGVITKTGVNCQANSGYCAASCAGTTIADMDCPDARPVCCEI